MQAGVKVLSGVVRFSDFFLTFHYNTKNKFLVCLSKELKYFLADINTK